MEGREPTARNPSRLLLRLALVGSSPCSAGRCARAPAVAMTTIDPDSWLPSSLGKQSHSSRSTLPSYSISRVGRHQREAAYVTEEHQRTAHIGREGPGPIYKLPAAISHGSAVNFTKGKQCEFSNIRPEDGRYTNDELQIDVDSQPVKYRRDPTLVFGTEPKGELKSAELLENHSAAFYARSSPGPANYGGRYGPGPSADPVTRPRIGKSGPFGIKLKSGWMDNPQTPKDVGPGLYPRKDTAIGPQKLTQRKNQSVHLFQKQEKFPKGKGPYHDPISVLDVARSSLDKQVSSRNKSEPKIGFGTGTRDGLTRSTRCVTSLDQGPKATMPRMSLSMPRLPTENQVMRGSIG